LALVVVVGVFVVVQLTRGSLTSSLGAAPPAVIPPVFQGGINAALAWTAGALLAAYVSVKLSLRLAGGRA
jgi:hypothetical protein